MATSSAAQRMGRTHSYETGTGLRTCILVEEPKLEKPKMYNRYAYDEVWRKQKKSKNPKGGFLRKEDILKKLANFNDSSGTGLMYCGKSMFSKLMPPCFEEHVLHVILFLSATL